MGYCYLKTERNLNPEPLAAKTKYNSKKKFKNGVIGSDGDGGENIGSKVLDFNPYSNLCGLVALAPGENPGFYRDIIRKVVGKIPPSYD